MRFEHTMVEVRMSMSTAETVNARLAELSADGWELVAVTQDDTASFLIRMYFKRPA